MTRRPTAAEQIDHAVTAVLDDLPAALPPALSGELATARALRSALGVVPPSDRFEDELARRLHGSPDGGFGSRFARFLRHHHRLLLTGAIGSLVLSAASTAVLAWRLVHR